MADAVRATLLARTDALPHWAAVPGPEATDQLAWNSCTPGYGGRLVFSSPGGLYRPTFTRPGEPYPVGWTHLFVHEYHAGIWTSLALAIPGVGAPPIVQPLNDGAWLVHTGREVHIVNADGSTESRYPMSYARCLQATAAGRAWVGYGEEQILSTGIGSACFAAFERDGTASFRYSDGDWQPGQVQPLNINAVNVVDDTEAWILATGPESLLVRMNDLTIAQAWTWRNSGPFGFGIAVDGHQLMVSAFSGPQIQLWDLDTNRLRELVAVDEHGPLRFHRATGRATLLY